MPSVVSCQCGARFEAADWLAGREVPCPSCGQTLSVPGEAAEAAEGTDAGSEESAQPAATKPATKAAPKQAAKPASSAAAQDPNAKIVVACKCGKRFQAGAKLLGKVVKCPGCGNPLKVQQARAAQAPAKTAPARTAPARPAPAAAAPAVDPLADPLATDLSSFDANAFDQGGLGGFDQAGFDQGGFGQAGFDQGGFGQGALGQGGFDSPLGGDLSMGYGQQPMGGMGGGALGGYPGQGAPVQQASGGGGSFELSPRMLVVLMSIAGGAIVLLLLAIFIPPLYRYLTTPAEVVATPAPVVAPQTPAAPPPFEWKPFTSPTGEYSIDFPGDPVTVPTTPNSFASVPNLDSPASLLFPDRAEFAVGRMPNSQPIEAPATRRAMIKAVLDAASANGTANITSRQEVNVGTNPGMEARIEGKNQNQTRDYESCCRFVMTKTHLYYIVYSAPKEKFNLTDANRFLTSFKATSAN